MKEEQTIQAELTDLMAQFAKNSMTQAGEAPLGVPTQTATGEQPAAATAPAAPTEAVPAVAPVVAGLPTTVVDPDAVVENWDSTSTSASTSPTTATTTPPTPAPASPAVDFSKLAKVLGQEKLTSEDELVKAVSEVKTKLDGIPEPLRKAAEIASQGGNYLEYLGVSQIDWQKADPVELYENYVEDNMTNPDGTVDYEKIDKFLDELSDVEKELRGRELQSRYIAFQAEQKMRIEAQARQERAAFENNLRSTLSQFNDVGGFKVSQAQKDELFNEIYSGNDLKFSNLQQRVITAFLRRHWNTINDFRKRQVRDAATREIYAEAQLPQITSVTEPVPATPTRGYSLNDFVKELEQKRGF